MDTPTIQPNSKPKFEWYEHLWLALPIGLVAVGGAIGGACGGAAWALNRSVFAKTQNPVLRYVWTGLISMAAVFVWLILGTILFTLIKRPN